MDISSFFFHKTNRSCPCRFQSDTFLRRTVGAGTPVSVLERVTAPTCVLHDIFGKISILATRFHFFFFEQKMFLSSCDAILFCM